MSRILFAGVAVALWLGLWALQEALLRRAPNTDEIEREESRVQFGGGDIGSFNRRLTRLMDESPSAGLAYHYRSFIGRGARHIGTAGVSIVAAGWITGELEPTWGWITVAAIALSFFLNPVLIWWISLPRR